MVPVLIDQIKCIGCGLCVEICPYSAVVMRGNKAEYILDECFLCGQCQAVCRSGAIVIESLESQLGLVTLQEISEAIPPGKYDTSNLVAFIRSRRSCRKYTFETVALDILEDLVKIGTTAPSGTNSQAWNFAILPTREDVLALGEMTAGYYRKLNRQSESLVLRTITKIFGGNSLGQYYEKYHDSVAEALFAWDEKGIDRLFHGATAVVLVSGSNSASCPAEDALLATQNILLAAHAMGLGSCLIGFAVEAIRRSSKMRNRLMIPDDEQIYSVIGLGYSAVSYLHVTNRKVVIPRFPVLAGGKLRQRAKK